MFHQGCGGRVYVDVTSSFKLMAEVNRHSQFDSLNVVKLNIFQVSSDTSLTSFYCMNCNREIKLEDIGFSCRCCNTKLDIEDTFVPEETNGSFCKTCCEQQFSDETLLKMADLLSVDTVTVS